MSEQARSQHDTIPAMRTVFHAQHAVTFAELNTLLGAEEALYGLDMMIAMDEVVGGPDNPVPIEPAAPGTKVHWQPDAAAVFYKLRHSPDARKAGMYDDRLHTRRIRQLGATAAAGALSVLSLPQANDAKSLAIVSGSVVLSLINARNYVQYTVPAIRRFRGGYNGDDGMVSRHRFDRSWRRRGRLKW